MTWTRTGSLLLATAALSACAGDNPENTPVYGDWQLQTEVDSLSVDGMLVPPEQHPPAFKLMNATESRCGEPMFLDRDWQQREIDRRVNGQCTLENYEVTPASVTGSGICTGIAPAAEFEPRFTLRIDQAADSYRMVLTMEGSAKLPGAGGTHYLKAIAVQEGTRAGDC